jgi:RND superfamily putative drug exporter
MTLLGRSNWWILRWLDRIVPNFSIEGEEWFRRRDEPAAQAHAGDAPVAVAASPKERA